MRQIWKVWVVGWLVLIGFSGARADKPSLFHQVTHDVLKAYVYAPDNSYQWKQRQRAQVGKGQLVELIMVSQTWKNIRWKHQLYVYKPSRVTNDRAILVIGGGSWRKEYDQPGQGLSVPREAQVLAPAAEALGSIIAVVKHVPFQPIINGRVEDQIISYTFDKFLTTGDTSWPLLRPMVKSAVRAMDTVQEFCRKQWNLEITGFTLTGASKRGWTTWLTSAVDPRVKALAPMVIDVLNMEAHLKLQLDAWGEFSEQIQDYTKLKIPQRLHTPLGKFLNAVVDPYHHRYWITQPKLMINGTNDRYWPLEALRLYWDDLLGPRWVLYVPNNGHGLKDFVRVVGAIAALHQHNTGQQPLPQFQWSWQENGDGSLTVRVKADPAPDRVLVWEAQSETMDFRPVRWTSRTLQPESKGCWSYTLRATGEKYQAAFLEGQWQREPLPLFLSTGPRIACPYQPTKSKAASQ